METLDTLAAEIIELFDNDDIEIRGEDFEKLLTISDEIKSSIEDAAIEGIEKLKVDLELSKPELLVTIDRDQARRLGVSTAQVASTIRTALFGKEISKMVFAKNTRKKPEGKAGN